MTEINKKNSKLAFGGNTDFLMKGALLVGSAGLALLLSSGEKSKGKPAPKNSKRKNNGFIGKTIKINGTLNALARSFYVYDLKKKAERDDDFPVKLEKAEIIEI